MVIKNLYEIGDILYLKTDREQLERIVVGIIVKPGNVIKYELKCGEEFTEHYTIEVTDEKDILKSIENKREV